MRMLPRSSNASNTVTLRRNEDLGGLDLPTAKLREKREAAEVFHQANITRRQRGLLARLRGAGRGE